MRSLIFLPDNTETENKVTRWDNSSQNRIPADIPTKMYTLNIMCEKNTLTPPKEQTHGDMFKNDLILGRQGFYL